MTLDIILFLIAGIAFIYNLSLNSQALKELEEKKEKLAELEAKIDDSRNMIADKALLESIVTDAPIAYAFVSNEIVNWVNPYAEATLVVTQKKHVVRLFESMDDFLEAQAILEKDHQLMNRVFCWRTVSSGHRRFMVNITASSTDNSNYNCWGMDIEESLLQRDYLNEMKEELQTLISILPIALFIVTPKDNKIVFANENALKLLKADDLSKIINTNMLDRYDEYDSGGISVTEKINEWYPKLLKSGRVISTERKLRLLDGSKIYVNVTESGIFYEDKLAIALIMQNTDEEKKRLKTMQTFAESEKSANELKSKFLVNMSHEIRTPMNAIIGLSELQLIKTINRHERDSFLKINKAAKNLLVIINDILDYSKMEAGKLELIESEFNVQQILNDAVYEPIGKLAGKAIHLTGKYLPNVPKYLFGDKARLQQVVHNLLDNAAKFTDSGDIIFSVCANEYIEMCELVIQVEDTGSGMSDEQTKKFFEPFTQFQAGIHTKHQGTGLGAPIIHQLVSSMHGEVRVNSQIGVGTIIVIIIPFKYSEHPKLYIEPQEIKFITAEQSLKLAENDDDTIVFLQAPTAKILVVDDNEVNLTVASGMLGLCGIKCETALNGQDSINKILQKDYDIVFMDHLMPVMDGIETTNYIRNLGGKYTDLTIIALTANHHAGARDEFIKSGMNDYLTKPINKKTLFALLERYLPQKIVSYQDASKKHQGDLLPELLCVSELKQFDFKMGLNRMDGMQDAFLQAIKVQSKNLQKTCENLELYLNNNELKKFEMEVHGIKGSFANLGINGLSEIAKSLETLSKAGNLTLCKEKFPSFWRELKQLDASLKQIFAAKKTNASRTTVGDLAFLYTTVKMILSFLDDFELESAYASAHTLKPLTFGDTFDSQLSELHEALELYDISLASEIASAILSTKK